MNRIEALQEIIANKLWEDDEHWIATLFAEIRELRSLGYNVQIDNDDFWQKVVNTVDVRQFYRIMPMEPTYIQRFKATGRSYTVHFETFSENTDLLNVINNLMENVITAALVTAEDTDFVGLQIDHPSLETPIIIPFRKRPMMTADLILNIIERVAQSKKELRFNSRDAMRFKFVIFSPPNGQGRTKRAHIANHKEWLKKKSGPGGSILTIKNDDKWCCARAIITAQAYVDKDKDYDTIARGDRGCQTSEQKRRAVALMESAGLKDHKGGSSTEELQKFQAVLTNYQIIVISKEHMNAITFEGPPSNQRLMLYYHNNHYDVIKSMNGFMGTSYWCFKCNRGYDNRDMHKCERGECSCCDKSPICDFEKWIHCFDCNRWFRSQQCFVNHNEMASKSGNKKRKTDSLCERLQRCKKCDKLVHRTQTTQHFCGSYVCSICKMLAVKGEKHLCYMQQITDKDYEKKIGKLKSTFIFYDIETRQDEITEDGDNRHVPNLIISHKVCDKCRNSDQCEECGQREWVFKSDDCLKEFCQWLFSEENRYATVIAHNAKGFDGQFLLKYLHDEGVVKPNIITRGMKIMLLEVANIRLIDSLNFLPMRLSDMPKTFGIAELKKGYFPHFFNTKDNEDYIGPMPTPDMYGIDQMKEEEREVFKKWYETQKDQEFNMEEEIVAYCRSDVQILQECCLKFRDIFKQTTGVDPLLTSLTIASACNVVFRKNFLKNCSIGLIPYDNYCSDEKQSVLALKYLLWLEKTRNIRIQHKLNGGEKRIGNYKADGFVEPNTCIEVYGCYYHGCLKCVKTRDAPLRNGDYNADELLLKLLDRKKFMEKEGYTVEEHWECQINLEKANNDEMSKFFKETVVNEPLNPRDAFFGGRTNSFKLYHKCEQGEQISYVDVCSLYPYICKTGAFPVGHPTIYSMPDMDKIKKKEYFGLIKCTVVSPKGLYHPVLPQRVNDKLMFVLCRKCAEAEEDMCSHTDEERSLTGTWTHFELYKALDEGYEITKADFVWHYENTEVYNPTTKQGGLFTEYINTFLKLKQESDGFPEGVVTEEQKQDYILQYESVEGVQLDINKIEKNSGLRALAKLALNSFWGKFGQRNNLGKMKYITEPAELFELLADTTKEVSGVNFYGDSMVAVQYKDADEFVETLSNTNVVLAAMVTAQARLKLYSYMEKIQERCLYVDTDSVIYLTKPTDTYQLPTGNFLGCLTNELKSFGEGAYISEFVGAGPKAYAYIVTNQKGEVLNQTVKVRGFTLDYIGKKTINFESMKNMVYDFVVYTRPVYNILCQKRICTKPDRTVVTKLCKKQYGVVYNKRYILEDFTTLPFGYGNVNLDALIELLDIV